MRWRVIGKTLVQNCQAQAGLGKEGSSHEEIQTDNLIPMVSKETLPTFVKPMMAQTISLADEVEDD